MNAADKEQIEKVLKRIPADAWNRLQRSTKGKNLRARRWAIENALDIANVLTSKKGRSVASQAIDVWGYGVLQDPQTGKWIREQIMRSCSKAKWEKLIAAYSESNSQRKVSVRTNATQSGVFPVAMARYWRLGSKWARDFCCILELPEEVWKQRDSRKLDDEEIIPAEALPPLHDYQRNAYDKLKTLLTKRARGITALLSLPTGAGKTRVVVEAICDHLAANGNNGRSETVLWIAHSAELQMQAWECFRSVWQVPPSRGIVGQPIRRVLPLRLVRLWGGRNPETLEDSVEGPEVMVASIDQLGSWLRRSPDVMERLKQRTFACVVVDEAHGVITQEFRSVLEALGIKKEHRWLPMPNAPLLIGLTATPWRKSDEQDASLHRFFSNNLVTSTALGTNPVSTLQERGVLSLVDHDRIQVDWVPSLTYQQQSHFDKFHELPPEYLSKLSRVSSRNAEIIKRLLKIRATCKTLVFACSIEHSEILTACLNVALGAGTAISVTSATARNERSLAIESFRQADGPRFLCTVGVLAAGFDAPKVAAVVITRPTMSSALYEQMVGRGLRGPLNGGTKRCRVIDVQDDGLPEGILSYARVIDRWTTSRTVSKLQ